MFIISLSLVHQNNALWENDCSIGNNPCSNNLSFKRRMPFMPLQGILSYAMPLKVQIIALHLFLMMLKLFFFYSDGHILNC